MSRPLRIQSHLNVWKRNWTILVEFARMHFGMGNLMVNANAPSTSHSLCSLSVANAITAGFLPKHHRMPQLDKIPARSASEWFLHPEYNTSTKRKRVVPSPGNQYQHEAQASGFSTRPISDQPTRHALTRLSKNQRLTIVVHIQAWLLVPTSVSWFAGLVGLRILFVCFGLFVD